MKLSTKTRVIGLAVLAALLPVLTIWVITTIQKGKALVDVQRELDITGRESIAQISKDIYGLCEAANDLIQQKVAIQYYNININK